jgi:aspartate/methionine/tyrosine aminotransferase
MDDASRLNETLLRHAPAAARCLSPLAKRAAFPRGIPFQSDQARATTYNATIGQVTDGYGRPLPLSAMSDAAPGLDAKISFLYSNPEGVAPVRELWRARQRRLGGSSVPTTLPLVVHGLTQGVSVVADSFADPDTDVLIPDPCWENYHLEFAFRPGARLVSYPFFADGRFNVTGLADALEATAKTGRKAVIVVNFPANPAGYTPTIDEARQLVDVIVAHRGPAVVLVDDAYQGMTWESGLAPRSLFWDIAERADADRLFPIKNDGATKELFFFGGRIAFLHAAVGQEAEAALHSKWKCLVRSQNGVSNGPAQALILAALRDPGLDGEIADRLAILRGRYLLLREALAGVRSPRVRPFPFNSGCFAMIGLDPSLDAESVRMRLIEEQSVGTIALPTVNALRVAYCSLSDEAIPEIVQRIERAVG